MPTITVADGPYDLTYRLTRADIAAWLALRTELRGFAKLAFFAPLIALGAGIGYLEDTETGIALGLHNEWMRYAIVFAAVVALYGFSIVFMSLVRRRATRRAAVPPGEVHLVASRAGVRVTHAGRTIAHTWDDILAVTLGKAHVVLATAPKAAIIVPETAFEDYEHMLRFAVFADEAMKAASARADARVAVVQRAGKR
ncbi:hypothetical protein [Ancylobacter terrae]|uniref:hypothetical protein n=1 Tax=Ancylobacter sp. sgz301288 TaxID=3342077 RepID=UPI00385E6BFE